MSKINTAMLSFQIECEVLPVGFIFKSDNRFRVEIGRDFPSAERVKSTGMH
jgi:hypothetical protein